MNKIICIVLFCFSFGSCIKTDQKDFLCDCTYVPTSGGSNKIESQTIKALTEADASAKCTEYSTKYNTTGYTGTCIVK